MQTLIFLGALIMWWSWWRGGLPIATSSGADGTPRDLDPTETPTQNRFVALIVNNPTDCHPWAWDNMAVTSAIIQVESGGNPGAVGSAGEVGIMQVKPATAEQMAGAGYTRYPPTPDTLATIRGGLYFGTAYLQWLSETHRDADWEWIVQAYNGGPGFEAQSASYVAARRAYLTKIQAAMMDQRDLT